MKIDLKIHPKSLIIKSFIGRLEYLFWRPLNYFKKNELVVLNYHSTPKKFIIDFKNQILFLQKHFNIISPVDVQRFYSEERLNSSKPSLLLTFDDGLLNNLHAVDVLNELNIKALFFIVPDFIDADNQKEYYLENIRDFINSNIDYLEEDFIPMSWQQIIKIKQAGHEVGSHSLSHRMKSSDSQDQAMKEVMESYKRIEDKIGIKTNAFCAPNNSLFSVSNMAMKMIMENYDYFYSTFPGSNYQEKNPFLILRSNVECFWPKGSLINAIGKLERRRWKQKRIEFRDNIIKVENGQN